MRLAVVKGQSFWSLKSNRVKLCLTELGGHLGPVEFRLGKRIIAPYSIAPWAEEKLPRSAPPILQALRGDFFCMPFGDNAEAWKKEKYPPHGETANKPWKLKRIKSEPSYSEGEWTLRSGIRKGQVRKIIRLRKEETVIYSRHIIEGMSGPMCFGHHPMLLFPPGEKTGILSSSPFQFGQVVPHALENPAMGGYTSLKQGANFHSLHRAPLADGGYTDLSEYPARAGFEDVVLLASLPKRDFTWFTVTFPKERFVWFVLNDPRILTATLLWFSNGGRHYTPWNGRHRRVLGIEQITGYFNQGIATSSRPNPLNKRGIKTALSLNPKKPLVINHIMGIASIPTGFDRVKSIIRTREGIRLNAASGKNAFAEVEMRFLKSQ